MRATILTTKYFVETPQGLQYITDEQEVVQYNKDTSGRAIIDKELQETLQSLRERNMKVFNLTLEYSVLGVTMRYRLEPDYRATLLTNPNSVI